ncbi:MAG: hypothetical protein RR838_00645 [Clostridium sp.]
MNRYLGLIIVCTTCLIGALVFAITSINETIKEAYIGNFNMRGFFYQVPTPSYILLGISLFIGLYIYSEENKTP